MRNLLLFITLLGLVGCSDDDTDSQDTNTPLAPPQTDQMVTPPDRQSDAGLDSMVDMTSPQDASTVQPEDMSMTLPPDPMVNTGWIGAHVLKTVTVILMAAIVLPKMMGFHVGCAPKIVLDYALTEMECPSPFVHLMWSLRVCVSSDVTQPSLLIRMPTRIHL